MKNEEKFELDTHNAKQIIKTAEEQKVELDKTEGVDRERVMMVFTRADVGDAALDRKSGELVLIEEITDKSLALIYQSKLAEQRIKSEIRDADSVFRKGFVVNVNIRTVRGKPVAYAVVHVEDVFDLPGTMEDADLEGADLEGADLEGVKEPTQSGLDEAFIWTGKDPPRQKVALVWQGEDEAGD